jgi:MoxR-like ATPase
MSIWTDIRQQLNEMFIAREDEIDSLLIGFLGAQNVLMLGKPGTGKTALADAFTTMVGMNLFSHLMTKETSVSEIFGPYSIKKYKEEDRYTRIRKGTILEADVAFLDEIFKCNSATLNSLLNAMNEHVYREEGETRRIPLRMVIGASNEMPEGPELNAMYDRFAFKHEVRSLEQDQRIELQKILSNGKCARQMASKDAIKNEIDLFWENSPKVVSPEVMDLYWKISHELKFTHGIEVSERKDIQIFYAMRLNACLNEREEVTIDDLDILQNTMWTRPDQRQKISDVVISVAKPGIVEIKKLMDSMMELKNRFARVGSALVLSDEQFLSINKDRNDIVTRAEEVSKGSTSSEVIKLRDNILRESRVVATRISEAMGL